jgi:putative lipoic acid-binding regulatory protein
LTHRRARLQSGVWKANREDTMKGLPSIELLESTHSFPCHYTYKVFGAHSDELISVVCVAAEQVAGMSSYVRYTYRQSSGGVHGCVTLEVYMQTAHQVQALYVELGSLSVVRMLM